MAAEVIGTLSVCVCVCQIRLSHLLVIGVAHEGFPPSNSLWTHLVHLVRITIPKTTKRASSQASLSLYPTVGVHFYIDNIYLQSEGNLGRNLFQF